MLQAPRWLGHELPGCNALLMEEIFARDERAGTLVTTNQTCVR